MGQTRVDLQHLLEDLRDAYTGALEETILTEVVANALDSGATLIRLQTSPADSTFTVVDNGRGMGRRELARYHDIASSSKARGDGIGFAGVGIKLGLLVSREVLTEARRGSSHVATRWHLASRHRAPWKWIPPPGLTAARGTAVQLTLGNQLSPLLDSGYLEEAFRQHFEPLLDPVFDEVLRRHYPAGVAFEIDGRLVTHTPADVERAHLSIRLGRRRLPSIVGYLQRSSELTLDQEVIAISTFGKIIKRGWDWLGISPTVGGQVSGVVEAPDLASCLTLSKNDFIRTGPRGATYLAYRKAIQEVISRQLAAWGDSADADARPRVARLERDLERVLEDLISDFPLLRSLIDRRAGGQKRLPMPGRGSEEVPAPLFAAVAAQEVPSEPAPAPMPRGSGAPGGTGASGGTAVSGGTGATAVSEDAQADPLSADSLLQKVRGRRKPAQYGLLVQFESRPDDLELARLVDSTIWINDAHAAYARAAASRSLGYHTAMSVALALAPLAVEARDEHTFITRFLAHWGAGRASRGGRRSAS